MGTHGPLQHWTGGGGDVARVPALPLFRPLPLHSQLVLARARWLAGPPLLAAARSPATARLAARRLVSLSSASLGVSQCFDKGYCDVGISEVLPPHALMALVCAVRRLALYFMQLAVSVSGCVVCCFWLFLPFLLFSPWPSSPPRFFVFRRLCCRSVGVGVLFCGLLAVASVLLLPSSSSSVRSPSSLFVVCWLLLLLLLLVVVWRLPAWLCIQWNRGRFGLP